MKKAIILGALLAVSCAKIVEIDPTPADSVKTIPFSVTVSSDETRATLGGNLKTLQYAAGDKLYIESESRPDVKAVLTLQSGAGNTQNAVFDGLMSFTGEEPADDLLLKATLVSSNAAQTSSSDRGIQFKDGKVTGIIYPTHDNCCTDVFEAVEKYSLLTGLGTFGERKFPLYQHTAFLSFAVNMQDIEQPGQTYSVYFMNDGQSYFMGNLDTGSADDEYRIKFALPVAEGTVLKDASVKLVKAGGYNSRHTSPTMFSASFGSAEPKTLTPKVYRVTKTATRPTYVNTGLPIIEIWTNGPNGPHVGVGTIDTHKDTEYHSRVFIRNANGEILQDPNSDSSSDGDGNNETNCTIKGRGNTTWNWAKKPYKLKLEKKTSLLELGNAPSKHWVLLANFMDKTMMRNRVAMEISSMMTNLAWTPQSTPVELYVDGVHRGNYLLIEQVRVDDGRVVVKPTGATAENENDVGFMLELDFHFDNYYGSSTYSEKDKIQWRSPYGTSKYANIDFRDGKGKNNRGIPFSVKEPEWDPTKPKKVVNEDQLTYIKNYVKSAGASLYPQSNSSYSWWYNVAAPNPDPNTGYPKYLNVESFIDYWIVFELMINHELGNPGSVYMTKPVGGKLTAGPCWDFDWGTLSDGYNAHRSPNPTTNFMNADAIWYQSLMKDYSYVNQLYNRFMELRSQLQTIPAKIDEWEREMAVSAELNFQMWNPKEAAEYQGHKEPPYINNDETRPYHEAVARIRQFYTDRLQFVEDHLRDLRNSLTPASNN